MLFEIIVKRVKLFTLAVMSVSIMGCAPYVARDSVSVSLASKIEPVHDSRQVGQKAELTFPLSIAIMFLPDEEHRLPVAVYDQAAEQLRSRLLLNEQYVRSVSVVSMHDMSDRVSLGYIRKLYDADVAVILSHGQSQHSGQSGPGALLDMTIVGAFVAPTAKTQTSTYVEGKVVHIESNALMFRSTGRDTRDKLSTSYGRDSTLQSEAVAGLMAATDDFSLAIEKLLVKFDQFDLTDTVSLDVTENQTSNQGRVSAQNGWNKVDTFKYHGGGSIDYVILVMLLLLMMCYQVKLKHCKFKQGPSGISHLDKI